MSRTVALVVGVVLILFGVLWALQGLDVIGGSGMSGQVIWAVIGPIVAIVGVVVILRSRRAD